MSDKDIIYRQDAIDAIKNIKAITGTFDDEILLIDKVQAQTELMMLPSAEPRKKGKWIEYNATGKKQWMCSECCAEEKNPKVARFCYWCGADMRGEQDD